MSEPLSRRHDLDWIRVGAFFLLILYHVGMFYVPWEWHVKSRHPVETLEPFMLLLNPWRLTLLFLVSGAATRFMADSFQAKGLGPGRLVGSRTLRLLPPLLFGMFVIVPPQTYFQVLEAARTAGVADPAHAPILAGFYARYATASGHWSIEGAPLITPTYNHLWFVAYLFVYTLVLGLILALPGARGALQGLADRLLRGAGLVAWPLAFLLLIRFGLGPRFPVTHALVDDWYNHALSFGAFVFGFFTARSEPVRQGLIRLRWPALAVALASWAAYALYAWSFRQDRPPIALEALMDGLVYCLDQGAFIAAILGFGALHLNRGGPALRYLTVGVFPFYIVHQTVIVVAGHYLDPLGLPFAVEAPLLVAVTFATCFAAYELARRLGWAGLLLGVKPERSRPAALHAAPRLTPSA